VVKEGMGHKELTAAEYSAIWEECYKEVLYVPAQNKYTRCVWGVGGVGALKFNRGSKCSNKTCNSNSFLIVQQ